MSSRSLDIHQLVSDESTRIIVCCGAGGVGKTTTAAAVALRAAYAGRTVAVLTIDPARRLAGALGVSKLTNTPTEVAIEGASGSLHAMMLDMRRTFDELVSTHTSAARAESIVQNPIYQTIAESFSGTQEYMAMEKLGQLVETSHWDLIVVDTPPSRNALDFLDAPQRLGSFLDSRLMRMLTAPGRGVGRMVSGVVGLSMKALSAILGSSMLSDAAEFVQAMDTTLGGFHQRAMRTFTVLSQPGTAFLVISTPEELALREAGFFIDRLESEDMPLAGLIVNRTHPRLSDLSVHEAEAATDKIVSTYPQAAALLTIHAQRAQTAANEIRQLATLRKAHPNIALRGVPTVPFELSNIDSLIAISDQMSDEDLPL